MSRTTKIRAAVSASALALILGATLTLPFGEGDDKAGCEEIVSAQEAEQQPRDCD